MNRLLTTLAVFSGMTVSSAAFSAEPAVYVCHSTDHHITIDGILNDEEWENAVECSEFSDIRGDNYPSPKYRTALRMLRDSEIADIPTVDYIQLDYVRYADVFPGPEGYSVNMVRQRWNEWDVDTFFPMNYNDFYLEPASWVGDITAQEMQSIVRKHASLYSGLFICRDWRNKASIVDPEGHGLLPSELETAVRGVIDAGADGICLFSSESMTDEHWQMLDSFMKHRTVSSDSLRNVVTYLASDECQGRLPFTAGADRACDYIAGKMLKCGLRPINASVTTPSIEDYKQYVPLVKIETTVTSPMQISGTCQCELEYLKDFTAFNQKIEDTTIDAELIFAGYGIVSPEYGKNDYAGIENPQDKVAIVIVNDPGLGTDGDYFNGNAMTYYGRWTYKFEEGLRQGLRGVLIIHDDLGAGYPWSTVTKGAAVKYALDDETKDGGLPLQGWLSGSAARRILESAGLNADSLLAAARKADFTPVSTGSRVKVSLSNKFTADSSPNIVGYIPGTTDECVVCSGHWDHLGITSMPVDGDSIRNGATDNATAVAWMLETARALKALDHQPRRSIVFLAPTTEELGMWGTEYYVTHPLFPMEKTVAVINKDVLTLWGECRDVTVTGFGYSDMDGRLAEIAESYGCYIMADPEASNGMFYRSDHLPFMRRGVPAMFAKSWSDSREHGREWSKARISDYWANVYHTVHDQTTPEDDYTGLKQEVDIFLDFILSIADTDWWPQWSESSEFQR